MKGQSMLFAITLAVSSGLLVASTRIAIKKSAFGSLLFLGVGYLCTLPLYGVWLLGTGMPYVKDIFWIVIAVHVPPFLFAQWLMVKAHRISQLTMAAPYLSLTTLFLFATSPIMLGTVPSAWGFFGAVLIVSGIVLVHSSNVNTVGELWRKIKHEPAGKLLIVVAAIYSFTANLDKIALDAANAPFYLLIDHGLVAIGALALYAITKVRNNTYRQSNGASYVPALLFGLFESSSAITHMLALGMTNQVPYVIAGKRAGTVLFATLGGLLLGLTSKRHRDELSDYKRKLTSAIIVIAGTCLVVFFG